MSLYGKDPKYLWGAIRNAQLAPIFFPEWKLRFYVSHPENDHTLRVPKRILRKLKQLGAEIAYVKTGSNISPVYWRHLVIDDDRVQAFLIRDADSRLSDRDSGAVKDWLAKWNKTDAPPILHCIRDHPSHSNRSIVDGLWGGNAVEIRRMLRSDIASTLADLYDIENERNVNSTTAHIIGDMIWPLMSSRALCHDSITCGVWPSSITKPFPFPRSHPMEYLGREFDQHEEPISRTGDDRLQKFQGNVCKESTT